MARKPNYGFEQRKREQDRKAKRAVRRARKQERAETSRGPAIGGEDPDLAGIAVGPQPKEKISQEEARRVVEWALDPGKRRRDENALPGRSSRLFVGNLDFGVEEQNLRSVFTEAGFTVAEVAIVKDGDTGRPRGFAFVEIVGITQAARAVTELDGVELAGRALRLNVADKPGRR
jgi:hypothetical protein